MSTRPSIQNVQDEAARIADVAKDRASDAIEEIKVASNQLVDKVRELVEEGNVRRLSVRKGEETLFEIPLTVGIGASAAALLLNPILAAVGAAAALLTDVTLVVERDPEAAAKLEAERVADEARAKASADAEKTMGRTAGDSATSDDA